ncbi:hypothetical protein LAZ67_1005115 [Cordylochernes scorpioides]|uniref:Uncharacterized protein n=1 Tax=Cordylochernes scorpioides TaxID=51811 RepID=A0ABY6JZ23_9ARAC|nr:hypothetical protein LAZ67_1005115 [Cordylochernes scorpioides]
MFTLWHIWYLYETRCARSGRNPANWAIFLPIFLVDIMIVLFFFLISTQSYQGIKLIKLETFDGVCRG